MSMIISLTRWVYAVPAYFTFCSVVSDVDVDGGVRRDDRELRRPLDRRTQFSADFLRRLGPARNDVTTIFVLQNVVQYQRDVVYSL